MPLRAWTLTDVQSDCFVPEIHLASAEVGSSDRGWSIRKRTLAGGLRQGVDLVEVNNGRMQIAILPTRGMGIWQATVDGVRLGWHAPLLGPVHPSFVPLARHDGLGWLQGFDELLCRCGLDSNGAPEWDAAGKLLHGLHGRIANLPAHRVDVSVDDETGAIAVTGVVDESHLFGPKLRLTSTVSTRFGESAFRIVDEVTNLSAEPSDLQLLYHINFGPPLVTEGARLVAPVAELAPATEASISDVPSWDSYGPQQPGRPECVHLLRLACDASGNTKVLLQSVDQSQGAGLSFNVNQLPCFTVWKNQQARQDGYVTGLEPGTNYPTVKSFERKAGRVARLEPGETRRFEMEFRAYRDPQQVAAASAEIGQLQSAAEPRLYERPQPGWSPLEQA